MNNENCPPADQLQAFLLGQLQGDSIDEITAHLVACPPCEETIAALEQQSDTVLGGLRRPHRSANSMGDLPEYRHALSFVKKIGRDATIVDDDTPSAEDAPPLGNLREYVLLEKLGQGGMGTVYKARHSKLHKVVAIKVLPADKLNDPQAVARFEREMRAVGQLDHPNIVRAMDAGQVDGTHFLVMEYVEGIDLSKLVRQHGPLPIADACELIRQAAIGLDEADERGMVHRDIKPSNIMLAQGTRSGGRAARKKSASRDPRSSPRVKILDLGLALLDDTHMPNVEAITSTNQLMGTLDYMAPEQGGDTHNVDIRADIYSLGATLYKLLTGESIYHGPQYARPVQKMMALTTKPAPPIQERRADIPDELAAVIHRMLEKDPAARYATPEDIAAALEPFCTGADLAALTKPKPASDLPLESNSTTSLLKESDELETQSKPTVPVDTGSLPVSNPPPTSSYASGKRKPASGTGKLPIPTWVAVGGGLLGIAALLAAVVFYFQTPYGTLRVEINDPEIEVQVKGSDITLSNADKEPIKLKAGEHTLIVTRGDDFTFETKQLILKKGESTTVKVELLPGKVQVVNSGNVIGAKTIEVSGNPLNFALQFNGEKSHVAIPLDGIDQTQPLTIEAVVDLPEVVPSDGDYTVTRMIWSWSQEPTLNLSQSSSERSTKWGIRAAALAEGRNRNASPVYLEPGRYHFAFVWRGKFDGAIYINGRQFPLTGSFAQKLETQIAELILGATRSGNGQIARFFVGQLDELRISSIARYDNEFTPPQLNDRYQPDEHTLALYHFDEGAGDVLKDSSGNGHHGKIVGAKWVRVDECAKLRARV